MTTKSVGAIVRRLSEPMKSAIYDPNDEASPETITSLNKRGLMEGRILTDLGCAVRRHMMEYDL